MSVEVLVATMNQTDRTLVEKMNIQTAALVGNQCSNNSVDEFLWNNKRIVYYSFAERGVGLNRNNTLMRATGDYCLFADDDMRYVDGYEQIVERAFDRHKDADVIVFNLIEHTQTRKRIEKDSRVGWFNFLRYGTARIGIRTASVRKRGIYFNQCFGGGTEHCHGEDNLFLASCLSAGLKIYAVTDEIAELLEERESSWNKGYDEKYIHDQGVLFRAMSRRWWRFFCFQDAIRRHKSYGVGFWKAYSLMVEGAKAFCRG